MDLLGNLFESLRSHFHFQNPPSTSITDKSFSINWSVAAASAAAAAAAAAAATARVSKPQRILRDVIHCRWWKANESISYTHLFFLTDWNSWISTELMSASRIEPIRNNESYLIIRTNFQIDRHSQIFTRTWNSVHQFGIRCFEFGINSAPNSMTQWTRLYWTSMKTSSKLS